MNLERYGRKLATVGLVGGAALLTACGGSSSTNSSSTTAPATSAPAPSTAPSATTAGGASTTASGGPTTAGASSAAVAIQNFSFKPQVETVKVGTTVMWTNTDTAGHSVQWANSAFPTSQIMHAGTSTASYSQTFNTAGTYNYVCGIHPFMTGKVVVTP